MTFPKNISIELVKALKTQTKTARNGGFEILGRGEREPVIFCNTPEN